MCSRVFTILLLCLSFFGSNAQTFNLVKEINTTSTADAITNPTMNILSADNILYFVASDGINGSELWKTDGTAGGTTLVKDIFPGADGSAITLLGIGNDILYFTANDGINGFELWRSDGTLNGTYLLKNIAPGNQSSSASQFYYHNGIVYFTANDLITGQEVWISDGTTNGTKLLKDISPGLAAGIVSGSIPSFFVALGNDVYFVAGSPTNGRELWKTNGTEAGTVLVKDVWVGSSSAINSSKLAVHDNKVYFAAAQSSASGTELWTTDGTSAGTYLVKEISSGNASPNNLISFNGFLYFTASTVNNNNPDLWKTDGTNAGTVMVKNFSTEAVILSTGVSSSSNFFTIAGDKLFFTGLSNAFGQELYVSDGSSAGTGLLKDITLGNGSSAPVGLTTLNGKLYFAAVDPAVFLGRRLYVSDGTSAGTVSLTDGSFGSDLNVVGQSFATFNNRLYFNASNYDQGLEIWSTNGVVNSLAILKDINEEKNGVFTGTPGLFSYAQLNGYHYFSASDNNNGIELWRSDGTDAGTQRVKDIFPGKESSFPQNFHTANGYIYFSATDGVHGTELWRTDGTDAGTIMVADIYAGTSPSAPSRFTTSGSYVYFLANHPAYGTEMWRSDGTTTGTSLVLDFTPGTASGITGVSDNLTLGDYGYYIFPNGRLYKANGITNTFSELSSSFVGVRDIESIEDTLYILTANTSNQVVLWKSYNGGSANTQVKIISNTSTSGFQLTNCAGKLYFNASNGTSGNEPWISDGTEAGTYMIKDINPGLASSTPFQFIASGNKVFFQAAGSPGQDIELWATDGTDAGTYLVKDIFPGNASGSIPSGMVAIPDNKILFTANDGVTGAELWTSDGTTQGTNLLNDFNVNGDGFITAGRIFNYSQETVLPKFKDGLIFFARSADKGVQLYFGSVAAPIKKLYVNNNSLDGDVFTTAIGNNANTGAVDAPFATINYALSKAQVGDTIYVDAGMYTEQVVIDKAITIWGAGKGIATIQAPPTPHVSGFPSSYANEYGVVQTNPNIGDVYIVSLTVDGANQTFDGSAHGILMETNGIIYDCEVKNMKNPVTDGGTTGSGIYAWSSNYETLSVIVENCSIHDFNYRGAFVVAPSYDFTVTGTTIDATGALYGMGINAIGFTADSTQNLTVNYNTIIGYNGWGVATSGTAAASIKYNSITGTSGYAINNEGSTSILATCNWYGSVDEEVIVTKINGLVQFPLWLTDGTDTNDTIPGFQPLENICTGRPTKLYVNDSNTTGDVFTARVGSNSNNGTAAYPFATIEYALFRAQVGDTIFVDGGSYVMTNATIDTSITILGSNYNISPNDAVTKTIYNTGRNAESIISGGGFVLSADYIIIKGFRFSPTGSAITTNGHFNHITLEKNLFDVVGISNAINLQGSPVNPVITSGFSIFDNRFERADIGPGNMINLSAVKDIAINENVLIETNASANRGTGLRTAPNQVVENLVVSNNYFKKLFNGFTPFAIKNSSFSGNYLDSCTNGYSHTPLVLINTDITIEGNSFYNSRTRNILVRGNTPTGISNLLIKNNNIDQQVDGMNGIVGMIQLDFSINSNYGSVSVLNNRINITGDYNNSTTKINCGIMLVGKHNSTTIAGNELNFAALNPGASSIPNIFPPVPTGIYISTDGGVANGTIPSTARVSILNNKLNGFKNSIGFYDPTAVGATSNSGYGFLTNGATVAISENSFLNDSMSINNGTVSQAVIASCNWYGSSAVQNIINKISVQTGTYIPYLTNGTDNDPAVGFQPVPGSCNGTPLSAVINTSTNAGCKGANDGSITITVTGGLAPYTFAWTKDGDANFTSSDKDPSNLTAGTYHVTITDALGSNILVNENAVIDTIEVTITEPEALTASTEGTNISCFNGTNGSASVVNVSGGTAPYSYSWSNGSTSTTINNLTAGTYTVFVTDAHGCTTTASYEVIQPAFLTASITNNSTACSNVATVAAIGGTTGYTYLWSNGSTSATISGVPAGTYSVTVTDANGCIATASITLTVSEAFNPSASVTNITCFGANNGVITITNANGTAPFMFSKDAGVSFENGTLPFSFSNLTTGIYVIAVKDANGCTGFIEKTVTQPTALNATVSNVQPTCFGLSTGAINVTVSGGVTSYNYSWNGLGGSFSSSQMNISNLAAGNYVLTVTDNNNCNYTLQATVPSTSEIFVGETVTNVTCRGAGNGSITVNTSGGSNTGFSYLWNTGTTTATISNLVPGNYNVSVTDNGTGCVINKSYTITQPASVVALSTIKTNATGCNNLGTITATGSGGTSPYAYSVNGSAINGNVIGGLYAGDYTIAVTDAKGCTTNKIVTITDNGSDEYEGNNSKNQAEPMPASGSLTARIALANDAADWFRFTAPVSASGLYSIKIMHPSVAYAFNVYTSGNNTPAIVPTTVINSGEKHYQLTAGTTYFVSITTANLSYVCYSLSVAALEPIEITAGRVATTEPSASVTNVKVLSAYTYPNPHNGNFTLSIESPEVGVATIEMFTVNGQKLSERKANVVMGKGNTMKYSNMNYAILFYKVSIGKHVVTGKVISPN